MAVPPPDSSGSDDAALSLTLAVVRSSPAPVLLLDGALNIVTASASFCRAFDIDPTAAAGREVFALGDGEWSVPQFRSLLGATVSGAAKVDAYEMDLRRPGRDARRLVIQAEKLVYLDLEQHRLLVAVSDVTDARADQKIKEDALARNTILLQEVRHRVANSLQIIASVLMQNARKVQSDESRVHLVDAHQRVMSVAALQKQLATSGKGNVELRPYFAALCQSIGASMIRDHDQLTLDVHTDDSITTADASVSLGLIVTELVINALKHAFSHNRGGKILVDYHSQGPNWALCVSDNGVGMPSAPRAKAGLGTTIVQALAKQLGAIVSVADANPGTKVSVAHAYVPVLVNQAAQTADRAV